MSNILEKLSHVPHVPGVYEMRDKHNHVIYIGKAKDLFNRLSNYFKSGTHDTKTTVMLSRVVNFEYFVCKTENDALGLEANLIKRHQPHYNILLKDNKTFPYIRIFNNKIEITRHIGKPGKYFGPYFNGIWAHGLLDTIYDIFEVREKADTETMDQVKKFLNGDKDFNAREILTQKMEQAAQMQQFELAIRYRNGLRFLDKLKERTITNVGRDVNCDVFAAVSRADVFVVSMLTVRAGKLIGLQNFSTQNDSPKDNDGKLEEFINQYYLDNIIPSEVICISKHPLKIRGWQREALTGDVKKGYKKHLLDMAEKNALEYIETSIEKINFKTQFTLGACWELGQILKMPAPPKKIECFDVSHLGGEGTVASMVTFIDGVAEKKLYRKFKIKHNLGNNDYESLREVLTRRLNRLGGADPSFGSPPDLIIIDGGKGQLSIISKTNLEAGEQLGETPPSKKGGDRRQAVGDVLTCEIPPFLKGVPADRQAGVFLISFSESDEIFLPDQSTPIILHKHSYALRLLQRIRDEAHRFAIGYHKKIRK